MGTRQDGTSLGFRRIAAECEIQGLLYSEYESTKMVPSEWIAQAGALR